MRLTSKQENRNILNMKIKLQLLAVILILFVTSGCGPVIEVPPAHVGKITTGSGLQEGLIAPSKIRLDSQIGMYKNLILAETADKAVKEAMPVFMPKDQLNLTVEVRGIVSVSPEPSNVDKIFSRLVPKPVNDRVSRIDMDDIYLTYGQNPIREVVRIVVTKYSIDELMSNRESVGQEMYNNVKKALSTTPLTIVDFGFADLQPPKVVVDAQEIKKQREIEIQRAEAEKQIKLQHAQAALEVANKQQEVDLKEAETQVLVNKKLAEGVSEAFIMQRALHIWENISTNDSKTIIMPAEAFRNPAILMGTLNSLNK